MKIFVRFLVAAAFVAKLSAIPLRNNSEPDGWFVPTADGKFFWMSREQFENNYNQPSERKTDSVQYFLYTKDNPTTPEQLYIDDTLTLARSNFNKDNPTRIIVHAWQDGPYSFFNLKIRQALMKVGKFNVIDVDWRTVTGRLSYASSRSDVPTVGKNVAAFIDFLNEAAEMSFESLTLLGLSLGSHVCGFAGKNVKRGRIGGITGLDPAYPLFDYSNCDTRLCNTDAIFVESIQTNAKLLGFLEPIGKATYYPNGGISQPGCSMDVTGTCSHLRSFIYYVEALLNNNFVVKKCSDYKAAVANNCDESYSNENMGSPGSHSNEGCYYVPVNKSPLYGMG